MQFRISYHLRRWGRGRECCQTVTNYLEQEIRMLLTNVISRQISNSTVTDSCSFSHALPVTGGVITSHSALM